MMSQRRLRLWRIVMFATCLLIAPAWALARASSVPPSMLRLSPDSTVIAGQLQMALALSRIALGNFENASDTGPLDELQDTAHTVEDAYRLIRAARAGMGLKRETRAIRDPLLEYVLRQTTEAWDHARSPVDRFTESPERKTYLESSVSHMKRVVAILERVLPIVATLR